MIVTQLIRRTVLQHIQAKTHEDAEDALQEACYQFLKSSIKLQNTADLTAWLLVAARNCLVNQSRHYHIMQVPLLELDSKTSIDFSLDVITCISIQELIISLTKEEHQLLALKVDGWSCSEIALCIGVTEGAAKKRWQRLRIQCQNLLEGCSTA